MMTTGRGFSFNFRGSHDDEEAVLASGLQYQLMGRSEFILQLCVFYSRRLLLLLCYGSRLLLLLLRLSVKVKGQNVGQAVFFSKKNIKNNMIIHEMMYIVL